MDLYKVVAENASLFRGVAHETEETIAEAERRLGLSLPMALKWLLCEHGYSAACGVANLAESVEVTLACRRSIGLSHRYVILDDKGDAGVVLLDTESRDGRIIWIGAHAIRRLMAGQPIEDLDEYADFSSWVMWCLEDARELADD